MKLNELIGAPSANLWTMRHLELVLGHIEITKDDTVLDVGCGNGFTAFILSKHAKAVVGIDLSEPLIDFLNKQPNPDNVSFLTGDATKKMHAAVVDTQNIIEENYKDVLEDWDGELEKLNGMEDLVKPLLKI